MPIYEYKCQVCSRVQTVKRAITDKLEREPYCDYCVIPMERLYDATPAIFRGKRLGQVMSAFMIGLLVGLVIGRLLSLAVDR